MVAPKAAWLASAYNSTLGYYLSATGSAPAFALLIIVFAGARGGLSEWLSSRPMVFLGEISFALYMIHYTVVVYFQQHGENGPQAYALVWMISLILATTLFVGIEQPARRYLLGKLKFASRRPADKPAFPGQHP